VPSLAAIGQELRQTRFPVVPWTALRPAKRACRAPPRPGSAWCISRGAWGEATLGAGGTGGQSQRTMACHARTFAEKGTEALAGLVDGSRT
jgi:hypothetical protein